MADLTKELIKTIKDSDNKTTKPYDTTATVKRVKDGIAYVHIAGGVDETPVKLTINAKAGDEVQVRVADGKAFLVGNQTAPPTDNTMAKQAINYAKIANDAAVKATKDALVASEAASSASASAKEAKDLAESVEGIAQHAEEVAEGVEQIARDAETSAGEAKTAADTAFTNLSQVQSVLEVAEWIATHGTYVKQWTFNPNATYYTVIATQVSSPSDSDVDSEGVLIYYERKSRTIYLDDDPAEVIYYERTTDTAVDSQKTYYTVVGTPVSNPREEDVQPAYYTLAITEAMANYIQSHLALTDEGLYVMKDGSQWKVLVADDGIYILDPNNKPVNQMIGAGNVIGYEDETHAEIDYHSLQLIAMGETKPYFWVSDLRDKDDNYQATITETFTANGTKRTFTVQLDVSAEVSATDSSHSSNTATRSGKSYTFATAPNNRATVTIVYKTTSELAKAYTLGRRDSDDDVGAMSIAEGNDTTASGYASHAEGESTATGNLSHSEGRGRAIGKVSHAEGDGEAEGDFAHAEGNGTRANSDYSHAEGYDSRTYTGEASHAEGKFTAAIGEASHAQNHGTITGYDYQTAIGEYNKNQSDNAFEIGNGTNGNNRSNAFAVDWSGNVEAKGDMTAEGDLQGKDCKLALDTSATSGVDKEIYDALQDLGWGSGLDIKELLANMLTLYLGFGKTLWTGTWNSGTRTITGISKYSILSMTVGGDPVIAYRVGSQFRFIGITGSSSQYVKNGYFNINGDSCTYGAAIQVTHNASGNHGSATTGQTITKVIGLVPDIGGGI